MVAVTAKKRQSVQKVDSIDMPNEELRWCSVSLAEVLEKGKRLDASVFDIEGKHAREVLEQCKWDKSQITGENGLAVAYHCLRFKRIWVKKSDLPIYQPSQIMEIAPKPSGFLSHLTKTNINNLRVSKGQVLLTCSGTTGNVTYVGKTLDNQIFSHDLIRINAKNKTDSGFIYAYLKSKVGNIIINTNQYGAVVSHIEPEHLNSVPIPNPPDIIKRQINNLIVKSFELRDESNELLDKAENLFYKELDLPPIEQLKPKYFDKKYEVRNYAVKLSSLNNRLDGSYHVPIVYAIIKRLRKTAAEITTIADPQISKDIILPGRFKRVYVEKDQGAIYFSGKHISELDPSDKKYLSFSQHDNRIRKQLTSSEGMILITCSGTLGRIAYVPKHWDGWVMTHDIIRLVPTSHNIAGYIQVFLSSDYGQLLILRNSYGAVVQHIEKDHIAKTPIPFLKNQSIQEEINDLALVANKKRTHAYDKEQQAIEKMNEIVIYATK